MNNSAVLKHVNVLSLNRIPDTSAKRKIINYVQNELAEGNIINRLESFEYSSLSNLKSFFLVFNCLTISLEDIFLLLFEINWIHTIFLLIIIFLIIVSLDIFVNPNHFALLGKKETARNIIGEISSQNKRFKRPLIIFSSHYENNARNYSQRTVLILIFINLVFIVIFFVLLIFTTIFILFKLIFYNFYGFLKLIILFFGFIYILVIISLFSVNRNQTSDQFTQKISGTALLIELSKMLKKEPLIHFDLIFLWTGGEKYGLWGIRNYYKKYIFEFYKKYELNESYNISIDEIGNDMGLVEYLGMIRKKQINEPLNAILGAIANKMNIKLSKLTLPNTLPYHFVIFKKYSAKFDKKIHFSRFSSLQKKKKLNSKEDLDKDLFQKNLENCINLCFNAAKSLDKRVE